MEQNLLVVQERKEKLVSGALNASREEKQAQRLEDLKILFQGALSDWKKYDANRQALMKAQLVRIRDTKGVSKDVLEVAQRSING